MRRGSAIVVAAALIAAACSDDSRAADTQGTASTTTAAPTTTSTQEPTTTTQAPPVTEPEPACPGSGALPGQAENNSLAAADTNGDGTADTLHSYTIGDPTVVGAWWLQVSFAGGGGGTLQIMDVGAGIGGVRVYDGTDLNGSGKEEFFAKVGAGASVNILGLFEVVDCTLRRVTIDGQPTEFAIGGSINFVNGLDCIDLDVDGVNDFIVVYTGQRLGESAEFEITAAQYALVDGALQFIVADGIGGNENDANFGDFSSAGCEGLEFL